MRLPEFILCNMEAILQDWETFAASLLPAAGMTTLALRNHAQQILEAVVKDLRTDQMREEQAEKSKGRAPKAPRAPETAAQTHAVLRAQSGFDINQLVAEYRALRASVLRLWIDAHSHDAPDMQEVIRFNEAIDQAVAESVDYFHAHVERSRNLLLGMLGHDMRTPLSAIVTTATYLKILNAGEQVSTAAQCMIRSGASIQALLDDLVDFNRSSLGLGLKVVTADIDLADEMADELEQLRVAFPDRQIELTVTCNSHGHWDAARSKQILRNLVSNAVHYGSPGAPIRVTLVGDDAEVVLEVANRGTGIDPVVRSRIFEPLSRGLAQSGSDRDMDGLGLGLFIVREIADAHGGEVNVRCAGGETIFAVRLPRRPEAASR